MKRRFHIHSSIEERTFVFECILDMDFSPWFASIQHNITVSLSLRFDCRSLERKEMTFAVGMRKIT